MSIKKKTPILIGTILFLAFLIANATYAYFASSTQITANIAYEALFDSTLPSFTAYVEKDLALQIYTTEMPEHSDISVKSDDTIIKVDVVSSTDQNDVVCTYDIDLIWESDEYIPSSVLPIYDEENNEYPYELSIRGTRTTTGDDNYTYANKDLEEINLDEVEFKDVDGKQRATIISGAEIHNQSEENSTSTTWTFTLSFYSLPIVQDDLIGKNFSGHFVVSNIAC